MTTLPIKLAGSYRWQKVDVWQSDTILDIKNRLWDKIIDPGLIELKYCYDAKWNGEDDVLSNEQTLGTHYYGIRNGLKMVLHQKRYHDGARKNIILIAISDKPPCSFYRHYQNFSDFLHLILIKNVLYGTIDYDFTFKYDALRLDFIDEIPHILGDTMDATEFWSKYTMIYQTYDIDGRKEEETARLHERMLDFVKRKVWRKPNKHYFVIKTKDEKMYYREARIKIAKESLVFGYIKNEIENKCKLYIPTMIKMICMAHLFGKR